MHALVQNTRIQPAARARRLVEGTARQATIPLAAKLPRRTNLPLHAISDTAAALSVGVQCIVRHVPARTYTAAPRICFS